MGIKISELPQAQSVERGAVVPVVQNGRTQKLAVGNMIEQDAAALAGLLLKTAEFSGTSNSNGVIRLGGDGTTRKVVAVIANSDVGAYAVYPVQVLASAAGQWFLAVETYQGVRQPDVSISGTVYYI